MGAREYQCEIKEFYLCFKKFHVQDVMFEV